MTTDPPTACDPALAGALGPDAASRFTARLGRALAALGGPPVTLTPLGVGDAFTRPVPATADGGAVPVHLYGHQAVVGPPGGCARCLERRWQAVRSVALRDALELGGGTRAAGDWPYAHPFAADALAALITAAREPRPGAPGPGGVFPDVRLLDLRTGLVRRYPLVPDPECPLCATPYEDTAEAAVPALPPAPKHRPGVFRTRPVESYGIDVAAFANPLCGALGPSLVQDVSSTSTSATIGCFSMRSGEYLRETFWGGHTDSFARSAHVGVLEGLERYAGMRARARTTSVTGSLRRFGADAVDPRETGLYSEAFHRDNPRVRPFDPDREIAWVWGWSLRDRVPRLVPEILTYYHAPGLENRFVQESSNGCASGGSLAEAAYFGLMEVVERDAFLLTWYGRQPLPEIDPASSSRTSTRSMVDRLAMYGYRARFFDTRITFPVPVVTAVAERFDGGPGRMCFGAGAGLDPESALASALCEIATDAVNLPGRTERDETRLRAMAADFELVTALHDHPLVYGVPEMGEHADFLLRGPGRERPRTVAELEWPDGWGAPASDDVRTDLERCVSAVAAEGFDVVVVDQTMPEQRALGLHTVSVLVPGLLPIDFGWSRQRALGMPRMRTGLFTAGLRERPLGPADLNPAPHPFP
ncbi:MULTISPECIES: TOMM precursor leader peptide-binding protein [Streptomyces]|uniref:TOMM precursor leader peptide-binding protein n=1 Tax=Streptomyces TaxID=1883 RepID=UPI0006AF583B|nr:MULTISPECIES: TOMM precursor leader peptide-binding protein [unclassified Streptomyces]KOU95233.1 bacteriocin biosynthesis protein SagD [Streptomyces sp. XY533]MCI4084948.1 TOMM precursor leader peptide-binding protein [Streptomyces sp. MMS21 TC-5]RST15864.1 bacteriocin biosynthesis protein SagD [Streptomyces sp. WAC05950]